MAAERRCFGLSARSARSACPELPRVVAWSSTALCVLGVVNFYNIPYVAFAILLRAFLSGPPLPPLEASNAVRLHVIVVGGAVASLGYGAAGCAFLMRSVASDERLAALLGPPVAVLALVQMASMPLTIGVFATGLCRMQRVLDMQQSVAPVAPARPVVRGVPVEARSRDPGPAIGGGGFLDVQSPAERDTALFLYLRDVVQSRTAERMALAVDPFAIRALVADQERFLSSSAFRSGPRSELSLLDLDELAAAHAVAATQRV